MMQPRYLLQHYPKTVLSFIFLLTVLIRVPQLSRPLSKHHELNTAAVLVCLQVWKDSGFFSVDGAPMQYMPGKFNTFYNPESRFVHLTSSGTYLSLGAGSYLVPYLLLRLFHLQPSDWFIRAFSLLLHFVSALLLFRLLQFLQKNKFKRQPLLPFYGTLVFLTLPAILWFMGNSYSHESMVIPFYLLMLYYGFCIIHADYKPSASMYGWYALSTAAAVYTDWLGAFAAFVFFVQTLSVKHFRQRLSFLLINIASVCIPICIILLQYISLIGWEEYKNYFIDKLAERSLPGLNIQYVGIHYSINFLVGYGFVLIAVITGMFRFRNKQNRYILLLAAIPFLHSCVFIKFSAEHDYSVLKWSPLMVVLAILAVYQLPQPLQKWTVAGMVVSSFLLYEFVNRPLTQSYDGERYSWMKNAGHFVRTTAHADEYVFLNTLTYYHQVEWYSGRNYLAVADTVQVRRWLNNQPGNKAVFFKLNKAQEIVEVNRLQK